MFLEFDGPPAESGGYGSSAVAFHNSATFVDQKIARFLTKQGNCKWTRGTGRDGALRRPDIAARRPYLR